MVLRPSGDLRFHPVSPERMQSSDCPQVAFLLYSIYMKLSAAILTDKRQEFLKKGYVFPKPAMPYLSKKRNRSTICPDANEDSN